MAASWVVSFAINKTDPTIICAVFMPVYFDISAEVFKLKKS